jgi:hypothetical protein
MGISQQWWTDSCEARAGGSCRARADNAAGPRADGLPDGIRHGPVAGFQVGDQAWPALLGGADVPGHAEARKKMRADLSA